MPGSKLEMWTIYENPSDYPGKFVVRKCVVHQGELEPRQARNPKSVCDTLEEARGAIPLWLVNLGRKEQDDPCIVETWI